MRTDWKVAFAVASSGMLWTTMLARTASAAPMDPAPERLVLQPPALQKPGSTSCQAIVNPAAFGAANGVDPNALACIPNNAAWANMMSELGYAIAPSAFHPARTTGFGGFALSLEASFAHINADNTVGNGDTTQYWHQGTRGTTDPNTNQFSIRNNNPDSILQIYTLKARKGLPLGFEIAGALGTIANTSMWVGGADLHWAFLEGYRTGFLGYLPDMSIGGGVRTVSGASSFYLTTVGIDGQISKPIALADSAVLTPFVGAQRLLIFADSTVVNLAPNVDPLQACGWQGNNVPGNPNGTGAATGQPVCANKGNQSRTFNNLQTFNKIRVQRLAWSIVGLTYRYERHSISRASSPWTSRTQATRTTAPSAFRQPASKQWTTSVPKSASSSERCVQYCGKCRPVSSGRPRSKYASIPAARLP